MAWFVDNILTIISMLFFMVGGLFGLIQWNNANKIKRAEFIKQIIDELRFDKELVETVYMIEYDYKWYNDDFHNSENLEFSVDKVLSYMSYICYLYKTKNIKENEFEILRYELTRACHSPCVQSYLWNLYHFSEKFGTPCSFEYLINYGIEEKLIQKQFKTNNTDLYIKRLNF